MGRDIEGLNWTPRPCLATQHCQNKLSSRQGMSNFLQALRLITLDLEKCGNLAITLETVMSCCDETTARVPSTDFSRRSLFKGAALAASVVPAARPGSSQAQGRQIKLAY